MLPVSYKWHTNSIPTRRLSHPDTLTLAGLISTVSECRCCRPDWTRANARPANTRGYRGRESDCELKARRVKADEWRHRTSKGKTSYIVIAPDSIASLAGRETVDASGVRATMLSRIVNESALRIDTHSMASEHIHSKHTFQKRTREFCGFHFPCLFALLFVSPSMV